LTVNVISNGAGRFADAYCVSTAILDRPVGSLLSARILVRITMNRLYS
jgi:hypothetical protein